MTIKTEIAFPVVAQVRKGKKKKKVQKQGRQVEIFGDDLLSMFRVEPYPGVDEQIIANFFNLYKTFTPTRIRAMAPFRSVWQAWSSFNEAYAGGRMVAKADDEQYITIRRADGSYVVRNGEPHRPYIPGETLPYTTYRGEVVELKLKTTNRLRLFLPELGELVMFELISSAFYDKVNLQQQLGAIQALADAIRGGNAAGIPFFLYRAEREITWNRPNGGASRVKKWLVNVKADPDWVAKAIQKLSSLDAFESLDALSALSALEEKPLEGHVDPDAEDDEDDDARYADGTLVNTSNDAEVDAYDAYLAAHEGALPASRDSLRQWVQSMKAR